MKKRIFFFLLFMLSATVGLFAQQGFSNLIIIGNKTGMSATSTTEIRKIFKAKYTNWNNGEAVTIVLPSPKTANADPVARNIYQTSVASMQKFWLSLVFQGRFSPPVFTDSDQETIQFIQKTPGAIGVVDASATGIPKGFIIQVNN
jgi:ABC-type phosphate transport system substrate-binding protein